MDASTRLLIEKVETLNGERPRAAERAAVRRGELTDIARLDPKSRAAAGASVTTAEYDALVADVHRIMEVLRIIGTRLS